MYLAMMASTECDNPLVADLSSKCAALREAQMMGIGRCAAANEARLGRDESQMILVPNAPRLGMGKFALIDSLRCDMTLTDDPRNQRFAISGFALNRIITFAADCAG